MDTASPRTHRSYHRAPTFALLLALASTTSTAAAQTVTSVTRNEDPRNQRGNDREGGNAERSGNDQRNRDQQERAEKERADRERAERAERERDEKERAAEKARAERERAEKERAADKAQAERERAEKERAAEKARAERERAEKERAAEKAQAERERAEKERAEKERAEKERAAEKARAERERAEKERAADKAQAERERAEKERAADKAQAERERAEKERAADKARAERERAERDREKADSDAKGDEGPDASEGDEPDTEWADLEIGRVTASGPGCSSGSWRARIDASGHGFEVTFAKLTAAITPTQAESIVRCRLTIVVPAHTSGMSYRVGQFAYSGYTYLESGVTAEFVTDYAFAGQPSSGFQVRTELDGPLDREYAVTDQVDGEALWSPCSTSNTLHVDVTVRLKNGAKGADGVIEVGDATGLAFDQRACDVPAAE